MLYGQSGAGKTTLGKLLAEHLNTPFVIDGDELREMFSNTNYGRKGREENIKSANSIATYCHKKSIPDGDVVVSIVNPYLHLRNELKRNNTGHVTEILLSTSRSDKKDYHVKDFETGNPHYHFNTDREAEFNWGKLRTLLKL